MPLPRFDAIPSIGWIRDPTPVTPLPALAEEIGLSYVGVKRDDLVEALHGGTKPRKLDYVLAAEALQKADRWAGVGAVGSGNLVALTAAASELGKRLEAHMFWTQVSAGVLDNLAFTASGPTTITYYGSRLSLALQRPTLFLGERLSSGVPIVPTGATSPLGMVGMARAGVELAAQIEAGEMPLPDVVYVAFGSGGTAVGLRAGLAIAGVKTKVVAVTVVERMLAGRLRAAALERGLQKELTRHGITVPKGGPELVFDHAEIGDGYARVTDRSLAACDTLSRHGIHVEPIYTGKAMAALLTRAKKQGASRALFWLTVRREGLAYPDDWRARLPPALAAKVARAVVVSRAPSVSRRRMVQIGAGAALLGAIGLRVTGYPTIEWAGTVLAAWEAHVVLRAAEALIPGLSEEAALRVAANVDGYLTRMPSAALTEVHAMIACVEHGTPIMGPALARFTNMPLPARERYLAAMDRGEGITCLLYRGLRDLCMLGRYQDPSQWPDLGYEGPKVTRDAAGGKGRMAWPAYDGMRAPKGALPKGVVR